MNQKMLIIIGIVVLIIMGTGGLFVLNSSQNNSSDDKMMKDKTSTGEEMIKDEDSMEKDDAMIDKSGDSRYIEYSKANLDNAAGSRRVLFFYASWCPTCRPTDANIKANLDKIPEDLTVIRVNYNDPDTDQEEKDLAKKYGITYQHTFVQVDASGKEITKWNGGQINELLTNVK